MIFRGLLISTYLSRLRVTCACCARGWLWNKTFNLQKSASTTVGLRKLKSLASKAAQLLMNQDLLAHSRTFSAAMNLQASLTGSAGGEDGAARLLRVCRTLP